MAEMEPPAAWGAPNRSGIRPRCKTPPARCERRHDTTPARDNRAMSGSASTTGPDRATPRRLTEAELATEAGTTSERVRRLVAIGALKPADDGTFSLGDIVRSRLLEAFEEAGITLEQIEAGIRERAMTLDFVELFYPAPSPRTGRDVGAFANELGENGDLLAPAIAAMGLPAPERGDPTFERDEQVLRAFLEAWGPGAAGEGDGTTAETTLRAARIFGDAVRRAAEGWVALFDEAVVRPLEGRYTTVDDLVPRVIPPAARTLDAARDLVAWLLDRHLERTMNALNISAMERELERRGLTPASPDRPPAVAFVDVSGYTKLAQERGDEVAARTAVRLAEMSEEAVRRHGGRVVKLLGDGVLLTFRRATDAVAAVLDLVDAMAEADLPPAHAGIHAGPVISRDGDVYGTTVNLASRVAGQAQAGEVVATRAVLEAVRAETRAEQGGGEPPFSFGRLVDATLKGVETPVVLYRVRGPRR